MFLLGCDFMQNKTMQDRPKFLNLMILGPKMAVNAKVSILHRVSGVLMVLTIPFLLYVLKKSLVSQSFYDTLYGVISNPIIKLVYLFFIWVFVYHICAGVRFLLLDLHKGIEIKTAQTTARIVIVLSLILTAILGVLIW